jgi:hypothetical protein
MVGAGDVQHVVTDCKSALWDQNRNLEELVVVIQQFLVAPSILLATTKHGMLLQYSVSDWCQSSKFLYVTFRVTSNTCVDHHK